jgi:hypothetical protein
MKFYEVLNEGVEQEFDEAGAPRTLQIMRGMVPKVRTLGFITAENPHGQPEKPNVNNKMNRQLESILKDGLWGYQKIKGKYGSVENTFLVRNISRDDLLRYGNRFNQESVLFGQYFEEEGRYGMKFQLLSSENNSIGDVMGERNVYISREGADDFYSEVKGRKFQIPFFDVTSVIKNKKNKEREVTRDYQNARWSKGDSGDILGSKKIKDVVYKPEDQDAIEDLQEQALRTTGFASYSYRGRIKNILNNYL